MSLSYDARGKLLTSTEEDDPNGRATTTYTYEPAYNQVTSVTDPLGHATTIACVNLPEIVAHCSDKSVN